VVFVESAEPRHLSNYHQHNHPTWFPIMPLKLSITIPKEFSSESASTTDKKTFDRTQVPLTGGFAMSDFRAQGSGMSKAIFDFKKPPSGRLLHQNIYVMLSRVGDWEDMAILKPFEDSVLQTRPGEELLECEEILKHMDLETQRRVAADFA
jgi:hypothetical protein